VPSTRTDRIEGLTTSIAVKSPCRVVSNGNVTFAGSAPYGFLTINGVTVSDNFGVADVGPDRVLLKDQTDKKQNGIWLVSSTAWSRALDFDGARDAVQGTLVLIFSPVGQPAIYQVITANPIIFNTTEIEFAAVVTSPVDGTVGLGDRTVDANTVAKDVVITDHAGDVFVDGAAGAFDISFLPNILPGMWVRFERSDTSLNANLIRILGDGGGARALLTADGDWAILKSHNNGTALKLLDSGTKT
jgi:hypothetical protein